MRRFALYFASLGLLLAIASPIAAQNRLNARESVAAAWRAYIEKVRNNDVAGILAAWTDDGVYVPAGAKTASGRAALDSMVRGVFATMRVTELTEHTDEILVDGNVAVHRGAYVETLQPQSGAALTLRHRFLIVWRRQPKGAWRIARAMTTDMGEANPGQ